MKIYAVDSKKKEVYLFEEKICLVAYICAKQMFPLYIEDRWQEQYYSSYYEILKNKNNYYMNKSIKNLCERYDMCLINKAKFKEIVNHYKEYNIFYIMKKYVHIRK